MLPVWNQAFDGNIPSAGLNELQARAMGVLLGNSNNDFGTTTPIGADGLIWQANVPIPAANLLLIDTGQWNDRIVWGSCFQHVTATDRIGQSTDYNYDSTVDATYFRFEGYLGKGAYKTAGGTVVAGAGGAPVRSAGPPISWFVAVAAGANVMLYIDPTSWNLFIYNNTASPIQPTLRLHFTAVTGKGQ